MVLYRIRLDASRPTTQASIYVKQGDSLTRQITFYLFQGSAPLSYPDPGITAAIVAHKPDGTTVLNDCTVDHNSNVITYVISDQMMTAAGVVHAELRVYGPNGEVLHSPKFDVHILDVLTTDAIVSSDDFSTLDGALSAVSSLGPLLTIWTNAVCSAVSGPSAGATCTVYTDEPEHVEFTFQLPQGEKGDPGATGNGIASIAKTGTVGKVDTYTITYTNGTTSTFTVTNGEDGQGTGDMLKSVYDTNDDGIVDKATADASGNVITETYATLSDVADKQDEITVSGLLKGDGEGGISAAVPGTDYVATNPVYIINATLSASMFDNPTVTLDKTYAEMKAAFDSGKELLLIATYSGNAFAFRAVYVDTYIQFAHHGKTSSFSIEVDSADAVTTYAGRHQEQITASGMLKGDGNGGVSAAVPGTDYQAPLTAGTDYVAPPTGDTLPASGTALTDNVMYSGTISAAYVLTPPTGDGWAHGWITIASGASITFAAGSYLLGQKPSFAVGSTYEFDVKAGIWVFSEGVTP